ncbi:MAG: hypothetical protein RR835_07185 [Peptostreptococcaceae bacterium]
MENFNFVIEGRHITCEEDLHEFILDKINSGSDDMIVDEDDYRGRKKKKKPECKPVGPKAVCLKLMFPYKVEVMCGCKQMIFGILVDGNGHPIKNPIIEFELSDYSLGNLSFSPALSFGDGCFCTTFVGERVGRGFIKMCCKGTDLDKIVPVEVRSNNCC